MSAVACVVATEDAAPGAENVAAEPRPTPDAPTEPAASDAAAPIDADDNLAALSLTPRLRELHDAGRWHQTPAGFRIIALSFLADGCAAHAADAPHAARACVSRCVSLAERLHPEVRAPKDARAGLVLSHYALLLGAADATGSCVDVDRHERLARLLANASVDAPTAHLSSFPGDPHRWPADQAATLAALARYDRAHGGHLLGKPLAEWIAYLDAKALDAGTGLPFSEVSGRAKTGKHPRGCALSWQSRYLAEVDLGLARRFWAPYRAHYGVDRVALVGFREWPPGVELPADVDSGPIVQGVGAAATALGIGAARRLGDELLATRLEITAAIVGKAVNLDKRLARHADSTLAEAILYAGKHCRAVSP